MRKGLLSACWAVLIGFVSCSAGEIPTSSEPWVIVSGIRFYPIRDFPYFLRASPPNFGERSFLSVVIDHRVIDIRSQSDIPSGKDVEKIYYSFAFLAGYRNLLESDRTRISQIYSGMPDDVQVYRSGGGIAGESWDEWFHKSIHDRFIAADNDFSAIEYRDGAECRDRIISSGSSYQRPSRSGPVFATCNVSCIDERDVFRQCSVSYQWRGRMALTYRFRLPTNRNFSLKNVDQKVREFIENRTTD